MNSQQISDVEELVSSFTLIESIKDSSFLITGATGLIGRTIVYTLQEMNKRLGTNVRIIALVRSREKALRIFSSNLPEIVVSNLTSPFEVEGKIDYVIHLASPTASKFFVNSPVETINMVSTATNAVLRFCEQKKIKSCLYASSLEVYGEVLDDTEPIKENFCGAIDSLSPRSSYSLGKRMMECLCASYAKEYGVPVKIARLAQTFGAGVEKDDCRVFAQFAKAAMENRDIVLLTKGDLSRCYLYLTDAVEAILYILMLGANGKAYNVANDSTYISIKEMAEKILSEFAPSRCVRFEKPKEEQGFSPVTKLRLDISALESLGWKPRIALVEMYRRLIVSLKQG